MISIRKVKKYCCEDISNIENYEKAIADKDNVWDCHHKLETHNSDGERRFVDLSKAELKALDMYYNRPAPELIFLTSKEHRQLHAKGKHHSEEIKRKISESCKGKQRGPHSEEWKRKISAAHKGKHWKLVDGKRVYY